MRTPPRRVLDLGCGTGRASRAMQARWPKAEVVSLDLALPMLREGRAAARPGGWLANPFARRPLPVWRAHWPEDGITVYADPAAARIALQTGSRAPYQRWLYHGLHSLDFAPLLARPLLRDALVLGLSLLGLGLCATSCVLAWRVLAPAPRQRPLARATMRPRQS